MQSFIKVLALSVMVVGCAEFSKLKIEDDGKYRFSENEVSVWAPSECLVDVFVYDTPDSVKFTSGRGYWQAQGEYSVTLFGMPDTVSDSDSFISQAKKVYQEVMVRDGRKISEEKTINVAGRVAYQGVSTASGEDVMVHTHIYFGSNMALAILRYPLMPLDGSDGEIPWACYNRFIGSIDRT